MRGMTRLAVMAAMLGTVAPTASTAAAPTASPPPKRGKKRRRRYYNPGEKPAPRNDDKHLRRVERQQRERDRRIPSNDQASDRVAKAEAKRLRKAQGRAKHLTHAAEHPSDGQ